MTLKKILLYPALLIALLRQKTRQRALAIFKKDWNYLIKNLALARALFSFTLIAYLVDALVKEVFKITLVEDIWLLIPLIIFGILSAFAKTPEQKKQEKITRWDIYYILALSIGAFALVTYATRDLGWQRWIIATITSILILLTSLLILTDKEDTQENTNNKKEATT